MQNRNAFFSVQGAKNGILYGAGIAANLIVYFSIYDLLMGSQYSDYRDPEIFLMLIAAGASTGAVLGASGVCFKL